VTIWTLCGVESVWADAYAESQNEAIDKNAIFHC
jgi:hypothetical protein